MKQYRSISIPEKLPSVHKIKTSRDHSSSRKEQFLQLSLKNPQIFKLHKENLELRSRLKEFNDKLNNLIFESKSKNKKSSDPDQPSDMSLDFLKKNLTYYE